MNESIVEIISGMLAPGIMISACGLLLLGMNNKYSLVVNRIRALNTEFRSLSKENIIRRESILKQLPLLIIRMRLIRNAVSLYTIGVALFIFSTFSLGGYYFFGKSEVMTHVSLTLFILALTSVMIGVIEAAKEVRMGFKILKIETENII